MRSDIIINGAGDSTSLNYAYPCQGVAIESNYFNSPYSTDGSIYLAAALGIRVNTNFSLVQQPLLGGSFQGNGAFEVVGLTVEQNRGFAAAFTAQDTANDFIQQAVEDWSFDLVEPRNYMDESILANRLVLPNVAPAPLVRSALKYNGFDVWELQVESSGTDLWGQQLELSQYAELQGALVYVWALVKVDDIKAAVNAFITAPRLAKSASDSIAGTTDRNIVLRIQWIGGDRRVDEGVHREACPRRCRGARPPPLSDDPRRTTPTLPLDCGAHDRNLGGGRRRLEHDAHSGRHAGLGVHSLRLPWNVKGDG